MRCDRLLAACLFLLPATVVADDAAPRFETEIRPILRAHCFDCHGAEAELQGGLDLRLVRFQQKGGESGAAIVPGNANDSLIWQKVESGEMPPGKAKVSAAEKELLRRWIAAGAPTVR
ncbi:MAG TPA: c-type cytochrome domain-containing protein, partial [Caulifigura sp.]|nr:c-type cytochrome domain-containing protein [Caulifigura sp.]